jgi:hypothetical protein
MFSILVLLGKSMFLIIIHPLHLTTIFKAEDKYMVLRHIQHADDS